MRLATKVISIVWSFAQLGKINVVGAEHLHAPGRRLIVANHSAIFDAIVIYRLVPLSYQAHYMFAYEFMSGNGGWRQVLTGAAGAFPVDRKNGKTVVGPAIDLLVAGENVVMFPEGAISKHAEPLATKSGAVRIARGAYDRLGGGDERVAIIPCHILYHKRDDATATADEKGPFVGTGLKWRGGVTVVFHAPIYMHEVAARSDEEVAAFYRKAIFTPSLIKLY
jgi:1-acyl-sn-glycerol-3-phosphate acyltransferase